MLDNKITKHKIFISYHHENDQHYKERFVKLFCGNNGICIDGSVDIGDIDEDLKTETIRQKIRVEYLRNTSVTILLISKETWKRKHVDW